MMVELMEEIRKQTGEEEVVVVVPPPNPIILGTMGSAYGILGWIRVFSFTERSDRIFNYQPWLIKRSNEWKKIIIERWKRHHQDLMIKVMGVENRESAKLLTSHDIIIDDSQLPILKDGEYYWKDLIGFQVVTLSGSRLGSVINLIETGSNDVLVVKNHLRGCLINNMPERLIPFLDQVIKKVDLNHHFIEVDWDPKF